MDTICCHVSGNAKYNIAQLIATTSTIATIVIITAFGFFLYAFFTAFSMVEVCDCFDFDDLVELDFVDFEDFLSAILTLYKRSRKMAIKFYQLKTLIYFLQLHNHKTIGVAINKAINISNIIFPICFLSLFMKFEPNCCQNHDYKSNHNDTA